MISDSKICQNLCKIKMFCCKINNRVKIKIILHSLSSKEEKDGNLDKS